LEYNLELNVTKFTTFFRLLKMILPVRGATTATSDVTHVEYIPHWHLKN